MHTPTSSVASSFIGALASPVSRLSPGTLKFSSNPSSPIHLSTASLSHLECHKHCLEGNGYVHVHSLPQELVTESFKVMLQYSSLLPSTIAAVSFRGLLQSKLCVNDCAHEGCLSSRSVVPCLQKASGTLYSWSWTCFA